MGVEIRLPNITGATEREQLIQLKSYLYQLSEQLQWAFDNISTTSGTGNSGYVVNQPTKGASKGLSNAEAELTFNSLKSLIIKSADIVDAYYDEINARLEGLYVAQSDFGAYAEQTALAIEANSTAITQTFENTQIIIRETKGEIDSDLETIGKDLSYTQNEIITIKGNVETIDSSLVTIESNVSELDTTLQSTKQELETTVHNTKTELSGTIDSAKTELNSNIDNAKGELNSTIGTTKEELNQNIASAKDEVNSNVEATKSELKSDVDSAKGELTDRVDGVNSDLQSTKADVNERIEETNENVSELGDNLGATNDRIGVVDKDLQDSKQTIKDSIQGVADSVTGVAALIEDTKTILKGGLDDLEFNLAGLREIVVGVTAYVKSGLLYYTDVGIPVYGVEIGQTVEANGEQTFKKFTRLTSEKLSFYDANENEVAYISDKKLYIGQAEITISFKVGGLVDLVMANGDVVTKWVGGNG